MILITGGCGFIGHHLVDALRDKEVWVIDKQLDYVTKEAHYITDEIKNIAKYSLNPDVIIHLAADSDVNSQSLDIVEQTEKLLDWAPKKAKIIFASSAAVYDEEGNVNPQSVYGHSKLKIEKMLKNETILRFFNVYGPHNKKGFIYHILNDNPIQLHVSDKHTRDFVHVSDVVRIIKSAIYESPRIVDVGTGIATNLKELAIKYANGRKIIYGEPQGVVKSKAKIGISGIGLDEGIRLDSACYNQKQINRLY